MGAASAGETADAASIEIAEAFLAVTSALPPCLDWHHLSGLARIDSSDRG